MQWWAVWLVAGFILLIAELLTAGGFFLAFFGLGAMITGALLYAHLIGSGLAQWLTFSVSSVVLLLLFRNRLLKLIPPKGGDADQDTLVGKSALVIEAMAPGSTGKVELRGTPWSANNTGGATLAVNAACRVVRVEGLTLEVE
jgi:inner membrane protein